MSSSVADVDDNDEEDDSCDGSSYCSSDGSSSISGVVVPAAVVSAVKWIVVGLRAVAIVVTAVGHAVKVVATHFILIFYSFRFKKKYCCNFLFLCGLNLNRLNLTQNKNYLNSNDRELKENYSLFQWTTDYSWRLAV